MKFRLALTLAALSALLVGCAGDAAITPLTPVGNPYAGTYESNVELDNLKTGHITLTANADDTASGTMVVSAPVAPTPQTRGNLFGFTVGTLNISGTVDESGHFTLTGTDPVSGDFNVDGDLSTNGTGTVNVRAGGQVYTSTITITHGTGFGTININNNGNANISSTNFSATPYVLMSSAGSFTTVIVLPSISDTNRKFTMLLSEDSSVGSTINLVGPNVGSSTVGYIEGNNEKAWIATGGQLKIVAKTATTLEVELINAEFTAGDATGNLATGSFLVNGTIKK